LSGTPIHGLALRQGRYDILVAPKVGLRRLRGFFLLRRQRRDSEMLLCDAKRTSPRPPRHGDPGKQAPQVTSMSDINGGESQHPPANKGSKCRLGDAQSGRAVLELTKQVSGGSNPALPSRTKAPAIELQF
jgi:hypothetical protein